MYRSRLRRSRSSLSPAHLTRSVAFGVAGVSMALALPDGGGGYWRQVPSADDPASRSQGLGGECRLVHRRYRTLPRVRTPGFCVIRRATAGSAPGLVLVTPRPGKRPAPGRQYAAMIVTNDGKLVWYSQRQIRVHDIKTIRYRGRDLLALYQRERWGGYYEVRDHQYREVMRIRMGDGYATDSHELQVTPRGTAYIDSYHAVEVPGVGRVVDWVMREIDIETRRVLFEWHAIGHVPIWATYAHRPRNGRAWDFFHGNSIDPPPPGGNTIIVSSRNTSAVYGIDRRTGEVRWVLGGKRDQFGLMRRHPDWRFCAQHDARRMSNGDITVFDNGGNGPRDGRGCGIHAARVPRFRLNFARRTVQLVGVIPSAPSSPFGGGLFPSAVGNARLQPNGDTLVNWGTTGYITQVSASGLVKFAMRVEPWTYRVVRASWLGYPPGRPVIVARRRRASRVDVWASWNGATQIHTWRVLAGPTPDALRPVGHPIPFADLETHLRVRTRLPFVAVRAASPTHRSLGSSLATRVG